MKCLYCNQEELEICDGNTYYNPCSGNDQFYSQQGPCKTMYVSFDEHEKIIYYTIGLFSPQMQKQLEELNYDQSDDFDPESEFGFIDECEDMVRSHDLRLVGIKESNVTVLYKKDVVISQVNKYFEIDDLELSAITEYAYKLERLKSFL